MRTSATTGNLTVHAVAGTNAVFLGFDIETSGAEQSPEGLLGFVVDRIDHDNQDEFRPLRGRLTFKDTTYVQCSLDDYCIQAFQYGDYSAKPGHRYTYEVAPLTGSPTRLKRGSSVTLEVRTESQKDGIHGIWFNRGAAAIDYFTWNYAELPKDELDDAIKKGAFLKPKEERDKANAKREATIVKNAGNIEKHKANIRDCQGEIEKLSKESTPESVAAIADEQLKLQIQKRLLRKAQRSLDKQQRVPLANEAVAWLSRGLAEAIIAFLDQATAGDQIRGCLYEFTSKPVFEALLRAIERGVDVHLVVDDISDSAGGPNYGALKELKRYEVLWNDHMTHRDRKGGVKISHNKFFVLVRKDEGPVAVWTGSTNLTAGGIFGHSNVGHEVRDRNVATTYLNYWNEINKRPNKPDFTAFNDSQTPLSSGGDIQVIFSPRGKSDESNSLLYYRSLMENTGTATFLTAAFGVGSDLADVIKDPARDFLRYVLMDNRGKDSALDNFYEIQRNPNTFIALGDTIDEGELWGWYAEQLTGLNKHVPYIHTKYMLIDPLGENPVVVSGSANFSDASTHDNDENMLVIRGNKRVADIYLTEFMRMFRHFQFRNQMDVFKNPRFDSPLQTPLPPQKFLVPDNSWTRRFYKTGSAEEKERLYFSGKQA